MGLFVLRTLIAACLVSSASSCSCLYDGPKHLQDIYCEALYVIQAKVVGNEEIEFQRKYTLTDTVVYKSSPGYSAVIDKGSLYTGLHDASCGINLDMGKTYIISGSISSGKLRANLCSSFYKPEEDLTTAELCYLRSDSCYAKSCKNCKIQHCGYASSCDLIKPHWNTVCTTVTLTFLWFHYQFCQ